MFMLDATISAIARRRTCMSDDWLSHMFTGDAEPLMKVCTTPTCVMRGVLANDALYTPVILENAGWRIARAYRCDTPACRPRVSGPYCPAAGGEMPEHITIATRLLFSSRSSYALPRKASTDFGAIVVY